MQSAKQSTGAADADRAAGAASCIVQLTVWDEQTAEYVRVDVSIRIPALPQAKQGAFVFVLQVPDTSTVVMGVVDGDMFDLPFGEFVAGLAENSQRPILGAHYTINGCGIEMNATMGSLVSSWQLSRASDGARIVLVEAETNVN
jgi:hypothetical protein